MIITAELLCKVFMAASFYHADFACENAEQVLQLSIDKKVDPFVFSAMIQVESTWKPRARSPGGACGLTQVMPKWSINGYTCQELYEPSTALEEGATHLAFWLYEYGRKRYKTALCGYNRGYRCKGKKYPNTRRQGEAYARKVLRIARSLKRKALELQEEAALCSWYYAGEPTPVYAPWVYSLCTPEQGYVYDASFGPRF